ncbi:MAG: hypothetical protein KDN19_05885, partial [Verrucomicrobiae bacterium]|nr:hypothetical protein [Verrucomicrobiae bacterium]
GEELESELIKIGAEHSLLKSEMESLAEVVKKAVDAASPLWRDDFHDFLTVQMVRMAPRYYYNSSGMLQQLGTEKAASIVDRFQSTEATRPHAQKVWKDAISGVIGKEAFVAREKVIAEENRNHEEAVQRFLDGFFKENGTRNGESANDITGEVLKAITPDSDSKELSESLQKLAEKAVDAHLQAAREDTAFVLRRTLEDRWTGFASMFPPMEFHQSKIWRDGLKEVLSPGQLTQWNEASETKRKKEEEKFSNILTTMEGRQRSEFEELIDEEMHRVIETTKLEEPQSENLKKAAKVAVDTCLEKWSEAGLNIFRRLPRSSRETVIEANRFHFATTGIEPTELPAWTEALEKTLTPSQQAAWQAEQALWEEEESKRIAEAIENTADSYKPQFEASFDPRIADVIGSLNLEEDRAKAVRTAGEKAIEQSLDNWKKRAREWLDTLSDEQRRNYTEQGRVPLGFDDSDEAQNQPAWKEVFETILTEDERKLWETWQRNREERRRGALSGLIVAEIEEWVGIDPQQWEKIANVCSEQAEVLGVQFDEQHFYMSVADIARALRALDSKKIKQILDETQWTRWEKAIAMLESRGHSRSQNAKIPEPPKQAGAMYVENAITEVLYHRNREVTEENLLRTVSEIEVCGKAAQLTPEIVSQLETAAKGAIEVVTNRWDSDYTRFVRQRVRGADAQTIHRQLAGTSNYRTRMENPLDSNLWKNNLKWKLTPSQLELWKEASEKRSQRRNAAIAAMIGSFFESRFGLNADQAIAFDQKLERSLETYGPDIEMMFGSYDSPWYLQYYSIGTPVMGIPEKELKEILNKDQFDLWESMFRQNAANYWDNVERYHDQRVKSENADQKKGEKDS